MKINYLLIFLVIIFLYLIHPFFAAIFSSALLAYIILPLFKKINYYLGYKKISAMLATFFSIAAFLTLYYSFYKLIYFVITELNFIFLKIDLSGFLPFFENNGISQISNVYSFFSNPSKQLLDLILMVFLIFYFLNYSGQFFEKIKKIIKTSDKKKLSIFREKFNMMLESIFFKYFLKSTFLGLIIFFSFSMLGIPYSFELSALGAVLSIMPLFNIGLLVLAISIYYLFLGNTFIFLFLLIESLFFTLIHYNFDIVFKKKDINPLVFITGAIAGVFSLGIFGFIAGPVMAGALQAAYETISEQ